MRARTLLLLTASVVAAGITATTRPDLRRSPTRHHREADAGELTLRHHDLEPVDLLPAAGAKRPGRRGGGDV
jgi:hypothetical protein